MEDVASSDFKTGTGDYLSFNASSISDLLARKLSDSGVFTDSLYPGSNLSTLIDSIGAGFGLLLWTLNQNLNESEFSESQIYENMNAIVKKIAYNPLGAQTCLVPFSLTVDTLPPGAYVLPRYSYVSSKKGFTYSLREDLPITRTSSGEETLDFATSSRLLYQGKFVEHPILTANGSPYETFNLDVADSVIIDHFGIDVYVKHNGVWKKWDSVGSLFLNGPEDERYEIRLGGDKKYTLKFGNNINGKQLSAGDQVAIYYLRTDGALAEVKPNDIIAATVYRLDTVRLREILAATDNVERLTGSQTKSSCKITNTAASTYFSSLETVESIRTNAPANFKSQLRVVTQQDYETFVTTNFANVVHDVKAMGNEKYMDEYLKYYWDLGFMNPHLTERPLINQVRYSNSTNSNNVYVFCVDKIPSTFYLPEGLKQLILDKLSAVSTINANVVVADPVYMGIDLGITAPGGTLKIKQKRNASSQHIKQAATQILTSYFSLENCALGQKINTQEIESQLLAIPGVDSVAVQDASGDLRAGLSLVMNSYGYPGSLENIQSGIQLKDFQFPYWVQNTVAIDVY